MRLGYSTVRWSWGALVALTVALTLEFGGFAELEGAQWDRVHGWLSADEPLHPDIVLVVFDESSLDRAMEWERDRAEKILAWPWSRAAHQLIVSYLDAAGARSIVYSLVFDSYANLDRVGDIQFADGLASTAPKAVLALTASIGERSSGLDSLRSLEEESFLARGGRFLSSRKAARNQVNLPHATFRRPGIRFGDNAVFPDRDGHVRSAPVFTELALEDSTLLVPSLALAAIRPVLGQRPVARREHLEVGGSLLPLDEDHRVVLHVKHGADYPLVEAWNVFRAGYQHAYAQHLSEDFDADLDSTMRHHFADKIVLLGDYHQSTPLVYLSGANREVAPILLHATLVDNLLTGDAFREAPTPWVWLEIALLALLGVYAGMLSNGHIRNMLALGVLVVLPLSIAYGAYQAQIWWPTVAPSASLLGAGAGSFVVEFVRESRNRRVLRGAMRSYMPREVLRHIERDPSFVEPHGRRETITVFLSDLAGFADFADAHGAEAVAQYLNGYLNRISEIVIEHGGTLDKFMGDAVLAFWNAPERVEGHERRACAAALDCFAEIETLLDAGPRGMRIGISTGTAVVGNVGGRERIDFTAIGPPVNRAARLEGANKLFGTSILVDARTRDGLVDLASREVGLIQVQGFDEPFPVFEIREKEPASWAAFREAYGRLHDGDPRTALERFAQLTEDGVAATYARRLRLEDAPEWDRVWRIAK